MNFKKATSKKGKETKPTMFDLLLNIRPGTPEAKMLLNAVDKMIK